MQLLDREGCIQVCNNEELHTAVLQVLHGVSYTACGCLKSLQCGRLSCLITCLVFTKDFNNTVMVTSCKVKRKRKKHKAQSKG